MAHQLPAMLLVLVLVLVSPVSPGPMADLKPDMSDQDLFWGSDQYDFSIVLQAAAQHCFWHFAHQGESFYLTYQVQWVTGLGHDSHLSVTVNSPSSLLVSSVDDANGQVDFKTTETGFYQMCFNNFHNRFGTMQIFLSFGVFYADGSAPSPPGGGAGHKVEELRRELNTTLAAIEETSHRVEKHVFQMFRFYNFGRMRKSGDYFLLRSNGRYVARWSAAQSVAIVAAGILQLLFLKHLFISTADAQLDRPRC